MTGLEIPVIIREPGPDEALAVQQVIGEGRCETMTDLSLALRRHRYAEMTSGPALDACSDSIRAAINGDSTRFYRVAVTTGTVVGTLVSRYKLRDEYDACMPYPPQGTDAVCELGSLYVRRDGQGNWRGQGIGTRLMQAHDEWASRQYPEQPSGLVVVRANTPAIRFYMRHGYSVRGDAFRWRNLPRGQEASSCFWMQRD